MDDFEIARADTEAARQDCFRIREAVFVVEQQVPLALEYDDYDAEALHVLVRRGGMPVATARVVLQQGGRIAKIGRVAVLQAARGTGAGAAVMRWLERDPVVAVAAEFVLEAQTHALRFYEKLGYAAEGPEYLDAGIPHRLMRKANPAQA